MQHGARDHAPHSASKIHRRFACPGSYHRERLAVARPTSPYAEEGTRAHEALEHRLRTGEWPTFSAEDAVNGMQGHLEGVVDHIEEFLAEYPDAVMSLEERFDIPSDVAPGLVFGLADIVIYVPSLCLLIVIDLKYGMHPVEHVENKQILFYGLGAYLKIEDPGVEINDVWLVIAQPRAYHPEGPIRPWKTDATRLLDFHMELEECIENSLKADAPLRPGVEQCKYCAAAISDAGMCPAKEAQMLTVAQSQFANVQQIEKEALPLPATMPLDKLAYVLAAADQVTDWLDNVKQYAKELALRGHHIPGRKLVRPDARRSWDDPPEIVAFNLMQEFGVTEDEVFPRQLIGITAIDALVREKARESATTKPAKKKAVESANEILATMTTKKHLDGVYSLVSEADRRPAENPAQVFNQITHVPEVKP